MRKRTQRGMALVGMLIAVVIIGVVFAFLYGKRAKTPAPTRPGGPQTTIGQSLEKGTEVACMNNLKQIRTAISMAKMSDPDDKPPADLQALKSEGITSDMLACPVTHQPYQYNPATGQVWCTTPGHEKF